MTAPISPYHQPGFYDQALAKGRHRDIVGGRWDETGRVQMDLLLKAGLLPHHHLLDIGAGSMRLGCKAVPYLQPGHYWATDKSRALMLAGHAVELPDPARLPLDHLIQDEDFDLPAIPDLISHAMCFGVFTHLPCHVLQAGLASIAAGLTNLQTLIFTVFLAPPPLPSSLRQPDGVVTHSGRAPYHFTADQVLAAATSAGLALSLRNEVLPRGQVGFFATLVGWSAKDPRIQQN